MNIVSLFSGAGGLDLGFKQAGFNVIWANEFDKSIWSTYQKNHPETFLEKRSIKDLDLQKEIPDCDLIIGGPPCQSWSEAGSKKGINDVRGKLFFSFIEAIKLKRPKLFLAENVPGIMAKRNEESLLKIIKEMENNGQYSVFHKQLNAKNFNSCQDRKRIIFIGIRNDFLAGKKNFNSADLFPEGKENEKKIRDVIYDLKDQAVKFNEKEKMADNNEYLDMGFSPMFMSRNRIRTWEQNAFTIQATGRHEPLHPDSGEMVKIDVDLFKFTKPDLVRRYSVRECARIQGFPDDFIFQYNDILDGYKMVGNAVSVDMAYAIANCLKSFLIDDFKKKG